MKKFFMILALLIIASHGALADEDKPRLIKVVGNAEVNVIPDKVVLNLGVETSNKDLNEAKKENDEIVNKILKVSKEFKIEEKDIQTDYVRIQPEYKDKWGEDREFLGYFVESTFAITVRDISQYERILTEFLSAGANHLDGINFQTSEFRNHKEQARRLAIKAAKEKAVKMAAELNQTIGKPYLIHEQYSSGYRNSNVLVQYSEDSGATNNSVLGQIRVSAEVEVSFYLN